MDIQHRKATAKIRLTDKTGAPLKNKSVTIDQTNHKFLFGCGAFAAVALMKAKDEGAKQTLTNQLDRWQKLFNYGTLPFYWGRYEPEEGKPDFEDTMAAAKYLTERGIRVKGHPLCWHTVCAPWLMQYPNDVILEKQLSRIRRDVSAYKGVIDLWDVINEVVIMPVFDKYDNAVTRICKQLGRIKLVKKVFEAAREANSDAVLLINDFNTSQAYEILIEGLLEAGVPIGAIGIQSHQHQGYWGKDKVLEVLERYSHFGLPIHFTENTLISGELMPEYIVDLNDWQVSSWPTTPEGEERQAAQIREMYSLLFENPLVEAITSWDFIYGGWLGAPSGIVRKDGSEKPAYRTLDRLIHTEWETHIARLTDEEGALCFTGFKGEYSLKCDGLKGQLSLEKDADGIVILKQ